jgi:hypothetical protein
MTETAACNHRIYASRAALPCMEELLVSQQATVNDVAYGDVGLCRDVESASGASDGDACGRDESHG